MGFDLHFDAQRVWRLFWANLLLVAICSLPWLRGATPEDVTLTVNVGILCILCLTVIEYRLEEWVTRSVKTTAAAFLPALVHLFGAYILNYCRRPQVAEVLLSLAAMVKSEPAAQTQSEISPDGKTITIRYYLAGKWHSTLAPYDRSKRRMVNNFSVILVGDSGTRDITNWSGIPYSFSPKALGGTQFRVKNVVDGTAWTVYGDVILGYLEDFSSLTKTSLVSPIEEIDPMTATEIDIYSLRCLP
jgi:hypothetical protein